MQLPALLALPLLLCASGAALCAGPQSVGTTSVASVVAPPAGVTAEVGADGSLVPRANSLSAEVPIADQVLVRKSERRLYLLRHGEVLRSYRVALGLVPEGPKERSGDFRTPEGRYQLTRRNSRSDYFLSIQVSYPNAEDLRRAQRDHVNPGGSIMIHGLPNYQRHPPDYYAGSDWTDGCIGMSNADMVELWLMVQDNTPIEIRP
jgi:murein L,D-transpeptidase YafK